MDNELNDYEAEQVKKIKKWKNSKPGVVSNAMSKAAAPVVSVINVVIPEAAIRGALEGANEVGRLLADTKGIVRKSQLNSIEDLRYVDLKICDKLANEVQGWAVGVAAVEGGATGIYGAFGTVVDIPAVTTLAMRTIHKIGLCYGFECKTEEDKQFALGILSISGSNSVKEKNLALAKLKSIHTTIAKETWKKISEKAANNRLSDEATIMMIKKVAKKLGINLTKRKALQILPLVSVVVGSSSNAWFMKEVSNAAKRAFQERWLIENGKIIDIR